MWKLNGRFSQVLRAEGIEAELRKGRAAGQQDLPAWMFRYWFGVEIKLFGRARLGPPGSIQRSGTEDTFFKVNLNQILITA